MARVAKPGRLRRSVESSVMVVAVLLFQASAQMVDKIDPGNQSGERALVLDDRHMAKREDRQQRLERGLRIDGLKSCRHGRADRFTERGFVVVDRQQQIRFIDDTDRSEEHTSELQSLTNLVCRLLLEKKKQIIQDTRERAHKGQ